MNGTLNHTLTRMAQSVESLLPAGAPPAWAEITGTVDDPEDMRWHRDVETLVGFVAPAACAAIATVGCGWAYGLPGEPHERVPLFAPGERRQARVVCLMTRSGDMAGYLREGSAILVNEPPTIGRIPDCIRRCFRLPTPPPEEPTDGLLASMWLNNVCGAAGRATRPLTWPDVAGLHPVMQIAADNGVTVPMGQLVRILRVASDAWSWTYLAQQAASPGWLANLLPPDAAAWMDEGMLSRWLLSSFCRIDQLLDRVTPLVVPAAAKRLRLTLGQLEVLPVRPTWGYTVAQA
ncbi:MAG: hypothetical protein M3083_22070 [Actinomycetota bacterium]|nr:hypothetical protein [Actinomycetota bacterium]